MSHYNEQKHYQKAGAPNLHLSQDKRLRSKSYFKVAVLTIGLLSSPPLFAQTQAPQTKTTQDAASSPTNPTPNNGMTPKGKGASAKNQKKKDKDKSEEDEEEKESEVGSKTHPVGTSPVGPTTINTDQPVDNSPADSVQDTHAVTDGSVHGVQSSGEGQYSAPEQAQDGSGSATPEKTTTDTTKTNTEDSTPSSGTDSSKSQPTPKSDREPTTPPPRRAAPSSTPQSEAEEEDSPKAAPMDTTDDDVIVVQTTAQPNEGPPQVTERISGEELEEKGIRSVTDALLLIPGASVDIGAGAVGRVTIDSLPNGHITVLRDGVQIGRVMGNPTGSGTDFGMHALDPHTISRIEVSRGLGPNGTSGIVVNIISKRQDSLHANITTRYGHAITGSFRREVEGSIDVPSALFFSEDPTNPSIFKEIYLRGEMGYHNTAAVDFDEKDEVVDQRGKSVNLGKSKDNPQQENLFGNYRLGWQRGRNFLGLTFSFQSQDTHEYGAEKATTDGISSSDEYNADLTGQWDYGYGLITHSTQYKHFFYSLDRLMKKDSKNVHVSNTTAKFANQNIGATFRIGTHELSSNVDLQGEWINLEGVVGVVDHKFIGNASFSLGDHWWISPDWDVEAQARLNVADPFGLTFEGLLAGGWNYNNRYNARLTVSRSRRNPTAEQLYLDSSKGTSKAKPINNPDLKPEILNSVKGDFGFKYDWAGASLSPFFHYVEGMIVTERLKNPTAAGSFTFGNAKSVMIAGATAAVEFSLPWNLSLTANYTYTPLVKIKENEVENKRMTLRPEHTYRAELSGRWLDSTLGARFWVDGRGKLPVPKDLRTALVTDSYADPITQINLAADYSPIKWVRIGIDLRNLTNSIDPKWGPNIGRYFMGTLSLML